MFAPRRILLLPEGEKMETIHKAEEIIIFLRDPPEGHAAAGATRKAMNKSFPLIFGCWRRERRKQKFSLRQSV